MSLHPSGVGFPCCQGEPGALVAGLAICGVVFGATSSAAILMMDFRTGYICTASPKAMFVAQLVGSVMGILMAPLAFLLFWNTGMVRAGGVHGTKHLISSQLLTMKLLSVKNLQILGSH